MKRVESEITSKTVAQMMFRMQEETQIPSQDPRITRGNNYLILNMV